jgi:hypothetical protein
MFRIFSGYSILGQWCPRSNDLLTSNPSALLSKEVKFFGTATAQGGNYPAKYAQ